MNKDSPPLEVGERLLGQWAVSYLSPPGYRFPGHLAVTDRRILFVGEVEAQTLQPLIVGAVDATAIAYALDLDAEHVTYTAPHLRLSIPKTHIECASPDCLFLNNLVNLTLRNNGSLHLFERALLPVTPLLHAIEAK
jgi:hypothetical protein